MKLLSQIKKAMEFNQDLYRLIDILKAIAISQYRVLEKRIKLFDKFSSALENLFSLINVDKAEHPLLNAGDRKPGIIAVTSDAG
jgi:F0F1-type ATP synthase gamma subunit